MQFNTTHYIAAKDCPYTLNGENLAEMRRARLNKIAMALELGPLNTKNETLGAIMARLNAIEADKELSAII